MKKWFTLSLVLVAAAVSHAVTVAWTVPNSEYDWARGDGNTLTFDIYFAYSQDEVSSYEDVYQATQSGKTGITVTNGYVKPGMNTPSGVKAFGSDLPPYSTDTNTTGSGFYYMVIVNKSNLSEYAVAGTTTAVDNFGLHTGQDGYVGVYANTAGGTPHATEYFDIEGWLGGTWRDAIVPEPTVMALLALGVAGVALRRKKNLTK